MENTQNMASLSQCYQAVSYVNKISYEATLTAWKLVFLSFFTLR